MTFTYSSQVSSVKLLGLVRLLRLWRASAYKLVFRELLIYLILYFTVSCLYRFAMTERQKKMFERLVVYSGTSESLLSVTFILGFYVSVVVQRWWSQFNNIGWPDRIMAYISVLVTGRDEHSRMIRRTMIRYLMLSEVLLLMNISAPVKKRFPNLESLVEQGLMTKEELKIYNDTRTPRIATKYWMPCQWCAVLMGRARDERRIRDSFELIKLLEELTDYKNCLKAIFSYDWVPLPLVYTQVATVAVYAFCFNAIISRQYINYESVRREFDEDTAIRFTVDMYVPLDSIMQLFFYLGWLKVAEQMLNPFGEDDDDFECNFILDRNLKVGLFTVDKGLAMQPRLQRDVWWDSDDPQMQYTEASKKFEMASGWFGSTADLAVPMEARLSHPRLPAIPESLATTSDAEDDIEAAAICRTRTNGMSRRNSMSVVDVSWHHKLKLHKQHMNQGMHSRRRAETTATSSNDGAGSGGISSRSSSPPMAFGSTPDTRSCGHVDADSEADKKRHEELKSLMMATRPL